MGSHRLGFPHTRPGFLSGLYASYADGSHFVGRQESMADDLVTVLQFLQTPFDERSLRRRALSIQFE